jgi:two-component system, cell cycle response regulator DivK
MNQMYGAVPTILVAEDDDDNRLVMKLLLELRGYRVVVAANGYEALAMAAQERPDLILLDLRMPQLNGLATVRLLRQHELAHLRRVPVVALSAYDPAQQRAVALAAGCNEYAAKPINYDLLEQLIQNLLHSVLADTTPGQEQPVLADRLTA